MIHFKYLIYMTGGTFRLYEESSSSVEIEQQKRIYMKTKTHEECKPAQLVIKHNVQASKLIVVKLKLFFEKVKINLGC